MQPDHIFRRQNETNAKCFPLYYNIITKLEQLGRLTFFLGASHRLEKINVHES
jgi:hypothetical protein